jgi:hypothetical protein
MPAGEAVRPRAEGDPDLSRRFLLTTSRFPDAASCFGDCGFILNPAIPGAQADGDGDTAPGARTEYGFEPLRLFPYRGAINMKPESIPTAGSARTLVTAILLLAAANAVTTSGADATDKEALKLELPAPTLKGTPEDLPKGPSIEPLSDKPRPPFMAPKGVRNVALGKPVTSSVKPFTGELSQITDGKKEAFDSDAVEFKKGSQWIQVDLGDSYAIYAIAMWHDHRYIQIMRDVIVQVSDDPEFKTNVQTLFNNDTDNSSHLGVGTDREYFETHQGRLIDAKGIKARYLRGFTNGSTSSALNCWQEIEVYALPAR